MARLSAPLHRLKRRAKLIARNEKIPLHAALDRAAPEEGFAAWSLLSARSAAQPPTAPSAELVEGDTLLLGARPGQGRTRLGLRLLVDAVRLAFAPRGTVAVIGYIQIIDQQRSKPPSPEPVGALRRLALTPPPACGPPPSRPRAPAQTGAGRADALGSTVGTTRRIGKAADSASASRRPATPRLGVFVSVFGMIA